MSGLRAVRDTDTVTFDLDGDKLTLRKRVYVFGEGADPAPFVRDVVNPAIHTHEVLKAA